MAGRPGGASVLVPVQIPSLRAASGVPPRRAPPASTRVAEPAVERRPFAAFLKEESKQAWTEQTEPRRAPQDIYGQGGGREPAQSAPGAFFGGVGAPGRPQARYDDPH